jgi:hypothetical protein
MQGPLAATTVSVGGAKLGATAVFNVMAYGALGNGTNDDTTAIQAAITACGVAGGGVVFLPPGVYQTSAALTINVSSVSLIGSGRSASVFTPKGAYVSGDIIQVGNGTLNPSYNTLASFGITCSQAVRSGGSGINLRNTHDTRITDFVSYYDYVGVTIDGGSGQFEATLDNFEINSAVNTGIIIGPNHIVQDCWIERGVVSTCPTGILYEQLSGGHLTSVDVIACTNYGIILYSGTAGITALFCYDVQADTTSAGPGWATGSTGTISNVVLTACWACSNHLSGISLAATNTNGVTITGCVVMNNKQHGIAVAAGTCLIITNCQIFCNSQQSSGTYHGISVGNSLPGFIISNNVIGLGGSVSFVGSNLQGYAIVLGTSEGASYIVTGNLMLSNVTGGLSDNSGTGTVANNAT